MSPLGTYDHSRLRAMSLEELLFLAAEIRHEIIQTCLSNGGHLGASLGAVELAIALHRVFESPQEPIVWDVGHQAYAHKLLTGRWDRFRTLRRKDGLSGFLSREESPHDVFGAGHSSTSLSAALAMSWSRGRRDRASWTVAVIGDGGLTAGLAFEALNNFRSAAGGPLLVVLNDNQMSISPNVGGIPAMLAEGEAASFFDALGLDYVGPMDGHDLPGLIGQLEGLRSDYHGRPVVLHVLTEKGKGYMPAEKLPAAYHGVSPISSASQKTYSDAFGEAMCELAAADEKLVAITAAMPDGTGLSEFARRFPDRFFDVGIAEAHAVTFAAGLAAEGWRPVVAVYSTFFQRAMDSLIHDVALQDLNVAFALDRAGVVGADGPTHHGAFDIALLRPVPRLRISSPAALSDLRSLLGEALRQSGPSVIRYPRGGGPLTLDPPPEEGIRKLQEDEAAEVVLVSVGSATARALRVAERLTRTGTRVRHFSTCAIKPVPAGLIRLIREAALPVAVIEDGAASGGFNELLRTELGAGGPFILSFGYPDRFLPHGGVAEIERTAGIDEASISDAILQAIRA